MTTHSKNHRGSRVCARPSGPGAPGKVWFPEGLLLLLTPLLGGQGGRG